MVDVEDFLRQKGIPFKLHTHPPVMTGEELEALALPGLPCKNLFLRDQKKRRYMLFVLPVSERADIQKLAECAGERKLSFVNAETLNDKLGVKPGAVSPFGLLNDNKKSVELFLSRKVAEAPLLHFHPNRNTASLELTGEGFRNFLSVLGHKIVIVD